MANNRNDFEESINPDRLSFRYNGVSDSDPYPFLLTLEITDKGNYIDKEFPVNLPEVTYKSGEELWNIVMPDGSIGFEPGSSPEDAQARVRSRSLGGTSLSGIALERYMQAMQNRHEVRQAIDDAGLSGKLGSPEVLDVTEAATRASGMVEISRRFGAPNDASFLMFNSADDLLAVADQIRAARGQNSGQ